MTVDDRWTAAAFAESWNRVGTVYTVEQARDWLAPIALESLRGATVLELGFGNGSLLVHIATAVHLAGRPGRLVGVELGDTVDVTRRNLAGIPGGEAVELVRGDLTEVALGTFDLVYSIGVLHHLASPAAGFQAVLRHTRPGGRFHVWVYAREGNGPVRLLVEPLRRVACRLPWWLTKYGIALPLAVPFFLWGKAIGSLPAGWASRLPLGRYGQWIARRSFPFFHHVAFDQLVTPRTVYLDRATVEGWLADPEVEPGSGYLEHRNGNSWKLGGRRTEGRQWTEGRR